MSDLNYVGKIRITDGESAIIASFTEECLGVACHVQEYIPIASDPQVSEFDGDEIW